MVARHNCESGGSSCKHSKRPSRSVSIPMPWAAARWSSGIRSLANGARRAT